MVLQGDVRRAAGVLAAAMVVGLLAGCASSAPAEGTVSFCVGTGEGSAEGAPVTIDVMRGPELLASPTITVPSRVSVPVSPGPFTVVLDGETLLTGTVRPGGTVSGSIGDGCPSP
jgi:hypothetical protein